MHQDEVEEEEDSEEEEDDDEEEEVSVCSIAVLWSICA